MKLYPGMEAEYEKRHNELWPEMQDMIHEYGGKNYTIFLDKETLVLYGYIEVEDLEKWDKSADSAIRQIKERNYPLALSGYCGNLLMVGINYDTKTKIHECIIEKLDM